MPKTIEELIAEASCADTSTITVSGCEIQVKPLTAAEVFELQSGADTKRDLLGFSKKLLAAAVPSLTTEAIDKLAAGKFSIFNELTEKVSRAAGITATVEDAKKN